MSVGSSELPKGEPHEQGTDKPKVGERQPKEQTIDSVGEIAPLTQEELDALSGFAEDEVQYEPLEAFRQAETRLYTLMAEALASGGTEGEADQQAMGAIADDMCTHLGTIIVDLYNDGVGDEQVMGAVNGILINDAEIRYGVLCDTTDEDERIKLLKPTKIINYVSEWIACTEGGTVREIVSSVQTGYNAILMSQVKLVVQIIEEAQTRHETAQTAQTVLELLEKLDELTGKVDKLTKKLKRGNKAK